MIRVGLIAVIGTCAFVLGLFFIDRNAGAQYGASQSSTPPSLEQEIKRVEAEIDKIFADTLAQLPAIPGGTARRMKRVQTLGKLELFDKQLSVNRNTACTFCHMPDVDFTGPISMLNTTRRREISMEGTFGICEPLATSCRVPQRSKRKTRQSILTRWVSRTPLALCTGSHSVRTGLSSKRFGGRSHSQSRGRPMSTACVPRPGRLNRVTPYLFI